MAADFKKSRLFILSLFTNTPFNYLHLAVVTGLNYRGRSITGINYLPAETGLPKLIKNKQTKAKVVLLDVIVWLTYLYFHIE